MIAAADTRKGTTLVMEGQLYRVLDYKHTHLGRGSARVSLTLRNITSGAAVERVFGPEDKLDDVRLELRDVQYLYHSDDLYHFMDRETYEQPVLGREVLGDRVLFLKEGLALKLSFYEGVPVEMELPVTVDLKVVETAPGVRGDTAQGGSKPAVLETGLVVKVPLFISVGDTVRVDTRTGEYVTRA
ncbi:MAG: elongation factor P [Chloroflexi bacterium]|nr:elongation factor P [Chloroflexota bacterium]